MASSSNTSPALGEYFFQVTDTFFAVVRRNKLWELNPSAYTMLGYGEDELKNTPVLDIIAEEDRKHFFNLTTTNVRTDFIPIRFQPKIGAPINMSVRLMPLLIKQEKYILIEARNNAENALLEQRCASLEERLLHMSPIDLETLLPSMVIFNDRIERAILRSLREAYGVLDDIHTVMIVVVADIIGLSTIYQKEGEAARRYTLEVLASRFKGTVRNVDTVAKAPGDSFFFIFEKLRTKADICIITDRLKNCVQTPIIYHKKQMPVSLSLGVAIYPENGTTPAELIKWAKSNSKS